MTGPDVQPVPAAATGPTVRASVLAVAVLYVLPFAVLWWFGPLAWVGLVPGGVGLRWTTHPPHRRRLGVLYLVLAVVSLGTLMIGLAVTVAIALTQAGLAFAFRGTPGVTEQGFVSVATFAVTWSVLSALMLRWQGVTLAPDGLHVHNLQARTIRWVDIASVSTDRMLGTTYVIVWEASGRSTRTCPTSPPIAHLGAGITAQENGVTASFSGDGAITAWSGVQAKS